MFNKPIENIVFYKVWNAEENKEETKAQIFYKDGTIEKEVSYAEATDACKVIYEEEGLLDKGNGAFKELINRNRVHVTSAEELSQNINKYLPKDYISNEINSAIDATFAELGISASPQAESTVEEESEVVEETVEEEPQVVEEIVEEKPALEAIASPEMHSLTVHDSYENSNEEGEYFSLTTEPDEELSAGEEDIFQSIYNKFNNSNSEETTHFEELEETNEMAAELSDEAKAETADSSIIDTECLSATPVSETIPEEAVTFDDTIDSSCKMPETKTIIDRAVERIKNLPNTQKITSVLLVGALLTSGVVGMVSKKNSKIGTVLADASGIFMKAHADSVDTKEGKGKAEISSKDIIDDNSVFDNYTYYELINATKNPFQKRAMESVGTALIKFNGVFADAYVEEGKDVRAALTFDEVVALHQAYNDFTTREYKEELKAYFNGAEIDANQMSADYKNATLQLMGAYVIENRENALDMSELIESAEGKEFYRNYHEMLFQAKEATGQDKLAKVKAFYDGVRRDFPITTAMRTEGISHAEVYNQLEAYKLSVTPMIAAAEMMFQNLEVDYTLNDQEIEFFNSIGLCNYADVKFRKIEQLTFCMDENKSIPKYDQYKNSLIKMLTDKGQYVTTDEHRDLSQLTAFQERVNGNARFSYGYFSYAVGSSSETSTYQTSKSWSETTYREEETRVEKEIPAEEKAKIDAEIAAENAEAKAIAEAEAEDHRAEMQAEEDAKAAKIYEEIKERAKDFINKISSANDKIADGGTVSEDDFGDHNVQFDSEHSDGNGNLDDSVENITTDPTGDQTGQPLPDPNETGKEFDAKAPTGSTTPSSSEASSEGGNEGSSSSSDNTNEATETKKSWATYDPVNGYDSQELHEGANASEQAAGDGNDTPKEDTTAETDTWTDESTGTTYEIVESEEPYDESTAITNVKIVDEYVDSLEDMEYDDPAVLQKIMY